MWVGGRASTIELCEEIGAVVNLWDAGPDEVASIRSDGVIEVTWGGIPGPTSRSARPSRRLTRWSTN